MDTITIDRADKELEMAIKVKSLALDLCCGKGGWTAANFQEKWKEKNGDGQECKCQNIPVIHKSEKNFLPTPL
jgi:hypothetical protein